MRILLVEDHPPLAEAVKDALCRAGFSVDHAGSARQAIAFARQAPYALILLDLGLPDNDGLSVLPALRNAGATPVIILTARDQLDDRLTGLDGGADDYIVKPVEMPELVARCRAVLRRPGERSDALLSFGPINMATVSRSVTVDNKPVILGRRELGVLEQLLRSAGRVSQRQVLEDTIYAFDDEVTPNALEAAVSRLRRALASAGSETSIVTVRGVGWMLVKKDRE
ncbi:two-component system, OmpR family, response regulator [Marinobacter sp. es.042]|uniref:response regulator n=1 Tax=Marinobacter sp. es.042 TaxID=1761794 RepID=UPI000B50FF98|nr:response regulator transcription factor [Marinobacter sp. es.042]SNB55441.1 two-component system, OmpR family, response regulator [Marinobacter sp. es.042]